ncbi:flagellar biosynthesis anti-sigma factor FlgM [Photobacterium lutimaris]|uniref:Negative regulator of flagellin synthesis n=1 Tax=Photobacterium lutimaris TaxID=388278 RepID=A0A2T3IUS4_9GAMM|nr:flagellar biosynthesis anti-sigma factor FlgM [Photobacterium lutimaris]PSU32131.1 flagellar biosynthesis anti-sigma factor FlgM [Photobacterium lutimaris]TDR73792.1 FlgM family anti-sigma-28 factor [Photobacterium lutimaris]
MPTINNIRTNQPMTTGGNVSHTETSKGKPAAEAKTSATDSDSVSLSSQGQSVGQIHQQLATQEAFDTEKVNAIKEAIANGSYVIDADKLAANMIKLEDDLKGL